MAIKLKMCRYKLAGCLRAAADAYNEAYVKTPAEHTFLRGDFLSSKVWCLNVAEKLEAEDVLGDVIVLEN